MSKAEDDVEQQHPLLSEVGDDQRQVSPVRKALGSHIITMSSFVSGTVFAVFLFAIFNRTRGPQSELEIYCQFLSIRNSQFANATSSPRSTSTGLQTY
jgi:hypothetical protein